MIDWKPTLNWGTDRGFTGHEQLDDIGLVHMNGRLYDATLARFLQADPALQDPANLQNLNRYAYCYANPLNCTDPSGQTFFLTSAWKHFWHDPDMRLVASIAVGIALGPAGGLLQGIVADLAAQSAIAGFVSGAVASGTFKGAVQGSFTAVVFYGVGSEFGAIKDASGAVDPQLLGQAVAAHAVAGCVTSVVGGGKCGPGALSAAFSKLATPITGQMNPVAGTVVSAVIGGTAAELGGGKFANGAVTGAFGYLFNCLGHKESCLSMFSKAGATVGFGAGLLAGGACDAATSGACVPANPAIILEATAAGAAGGAAVGAVVDSLEKRPNGNSWLSPDPTSVYVLTSNVDGSVLKFGITNLVGNEIGRYSFAELTALNANMTIIATFDSRAPARMLEIGLCMGYAATHNGNLPPASQKC